jgi:hypothetical protein
MNLTDDETIRANSCGSRGASLYLVGPISYDDMLTEYFMDSSTFTTAIRLRLGKKVRGDLSDTCELCNRDHRTDDLGDSALTCMRCGRRVRAHNALRDHVVKICRDALLAPTVEPRISMKSAQRGDISVQMAGKLWVIDVAITHPFASDNRLHALNKPAGAATAYEAVKVKKYSGILPKSQVLIPFVLDTYGALGATAIEALQKFVPHYARRLGITSTVASRIAFGRITISVIRSMASIAAQG